MWWLSSKFGALRWEGRRFESCSGCHVKTLSKFLTNVLQYMYLGIFAADLNGATTHMGLDSGARAPLIEEG